MTDSKGEERDIRLGPLFTAGFVLAAYGIFRRRALAVLAGLVSIWLDQRTAFGRSLTDRAMTKFMPAEPDEDEPSGETPPT